MNRTNKIIWIISIAALCVLGVIFYNVYSKKSPKSNNIVDEYQTEASDSFSDGLKNPSSVSTYTLDDDEIGITEKSIYLVDINGDNKKDRITKTFFENGNAHSYYEYTVELNQNGKYVDITPNNLRTVNGADCDLQQIKFLFKPSFKIIMIYRDMGETWVDATMAKKRVYSLNKDKLDASADKNLRNVCDVKELF